LHKKTGNRIFFNGFPVIFSVYERARSSCGRPGGAGAPTEPAGETEPFEARRASNKKSGWGILIVQEMSKKKGLNLTI
jgi:hypothetical protein